MERLNDRTFLVGQSNGADLFASIPHDNTAYHATSRLPEGKSFGPSFADGLPGQDEDFTYLAHSTPIPASRSGQPECPGADVDTETLQCLLTAIDRLRRERNDLKRQLEFSQMEHKFAVEAWEARATASPLEDLRQNKVIVNPQPTVQGSIDAQASTQEKVVDLYQRRVKRLNLALTASSIVIERFQFSLDCATDNLDRVLQGKEDQNSEAQTRISMLEAQLTHTTKNLSEVEKQRIELLSRVEVIEGTTSRSQQETLDDKETLRRSKEELAQAQSQLVGLTNLLCGDGAGFS